MKKILTFTLVMVIFLAAPAFGSQDLNEKSSTGEISRGINELRDKEKIISNEIEILRRDQVNYKTEKDLLKEMYSSYLLVINVGITIATVIFAICGYLGFKNIKDIKKEYQEELDKLRSLKAPFIRNLAKLKQQQSTLASEINSLSSSNQKQDERLEVLELIEKASNLMHGGSWEWALKYINIALEKDGDQALLLALKAQCLSMLGDVDKAIEALKLSLKNNDQYNTHSVTGLLELSAIANNLDDFNRLYDKYKNDIEKEKDGALAPYLTALRDLFNDDKKAAIQTLKTYADTQNAGQNQRLGSWNFGEINTAVKSVKNVDIRDLLTATVSYFGGQMNNSDFIEILNKNENS